MHALPNDWLKNVWRDRLERLGFDLGLDGLILATHADAPDARAMAFALLGIGGHKQALEEVRAGFDDDYPPARAEAARAAGLLGDTAAATAQLRALLAIDWPETAINAAAYLADLGDGSGWPVIEKAAASGVEALRLQAALLARAFWEQDTAAVIALLDKASGDPSALVRREAVGQIAGLRDKAARRRLLERATRDDDRDVSRLATTKLSEGGSS